MITEIGAIFPANEQFGRQENFIYNNLKQQIATKFATDNNLIINLTWFGPQFNNNQWQALQQIISENRTFDNLFWFCIVDPVTLTPPQFKDVESSLHIKNIYHVGPGFFGPYFFHTHSIACLEDFIDYSETDLALTDIQFLYLNYNRKPKPHRIALVELLHKHNLQNHGIITLGKDDSDYDVGQGSCTNLYLTIDDDLDCTRGGRFTKHNNFGGIPYDLFSLGNLEVWQKHFLNVVSETEFNPWDNMFFTEKTLKPIIGMRPFIINGQTKIYKYLRDQGFKTFTHYFSDIELENIKEFEVHGSIIRVLEYLASITKTELSDMYQDMLPDLRHNRKRFFEFATEQKDKVVHLFR
jgi:hypothetical protein